MKNKVSMNFVRSVKTTLKEEEDLFNQIEKKFNLILFELIFQFDTPTISIILKSPFKDRKILFIELVEKKQKNEIFYNMEIKYVIKDDKDNLIDTNSIKNYFLSYGNEYALFPENLSESILEWLYENRLSFNNYTKVRNFTEKDLRAIQLMFDEFNNKIKQKKKTKEIPFKDLFLYNKKQLKTLANFSFEQNTNNLLIFLSDSKGKSKSFIIHIGDNIHENEFLMDFIPKDKNAKNIRTDMIADWNKGEIEGKKKIYFIEKIYLINENKVRIIYSMVSSENKNISRNISEEIIEKDDKFSNHKDEYSIVKIERPLFQFTDTLTLTYYNADDGNYYIDVISNQRKDESVLLSKINDKLKIISISFISKPKKLIIIDLMRFGEYNSFYQIIIIEIPKINKTRVILLEKGYESIYKVSLEEIVNEDMKINEIFSYFIIQENYDLQSELSLKKEIYYLFNFKLIEFSEIDLIPYTEFPFQLTHIPITHLDQSIIYIKRKDGRKFTQNNKFVLYMYITTKLKESKINYFLTKELMDLRTDKSLQSIQDHTSNIDNIFLQFNKLISEQEVENFKEVLYDAFDEYSTDDDLRDNIINEFKRKLLEQQFEIDHSNKFEYVNSEIEEIRKGLEYYIHLKFKFFSFVEESFTIKYLLGRKYFWIVFNSLNKYHIKRFKKTFKGFDKYSTNLPTMYLYFNDIVDFVNLFVKEIYPYKKDVKNNSIGFTVDTIFVLSQSKKGKKTHQIILGEKISVIDYMYAEDDKSFRTLKNANPIIESIIAVMDYRSNILVSVNFDTSMANIGLKVGETLNDHTIQEILLEVESDDRELHEDQVDELNIKLGDNIGDPNTKYLLVKKGDITSELQKELGFTEKIQEIRKYFDNSSASLITEKEKYAFKVNNRVRMENAGTELEKICLGITENIKGFEQVNSVLVVFIDIDGNFYHISYISEESNPETSLINTIGKIDKIIISDDNLKLKLFMNNKENNFEVNLANLYPIYLMENNYKEIKKLPIFQIHRNKEVGTSNFTIKSVFNLKDLKVESYLKYIDFWFADKKSYEQLEKIITSLDENILPIKDAKIIKETQTPIESQEKKESDTDKISRLTIEDIAGCWNIDKKLRYKLYFYLNPTQQDDVADITKERFNDLGLGSLIWQEISIGLVNEMEKKIINIIEIFTKLGMFGFTSEWWRNLTKEQNEYFIPYLSVSYEIIYNKEWNELTQFQDEFNAFLTQLKEVLTDCVFLKEAQIPEKKFIPEYFIPLIHDKEIVEFSTIWNNLSEFDRNKLNNSFSFPKLKNPKARWMADPHHNEIMSKITQLKSILNNFIGYTISAQQITIIGLEDLWDKHLKELSKKELIKLLIDLKSLQYDISDYEDRKWYNLKSDFKVKLGDKLSLIKSLLLSGMFPNSVQWEGVVLNVVATLKSPLMKISQIILDRIRIIFLEDEDLAEGLKGELTTYCLGIFPEISLSKKDELINDFINILVKEIDKEQIVIEEYFILYEKEALKIIERHLNILKKTLEELKVLSSPLKEIEFTEIEFETEKKDLMIENYEKETGKKAFINGKETIEYKEWHKIPINWILDDDLWESFWDDRRDDLNPINETILDIYGLEESNISQYANKRWKNLDKEIQDGIKKLFKEKTIGYVDDYITQKIEEKKKKSVEKPKKIVESISNKEEEALLEAYNTESGRDGRWRGKFTRQYLDWKKNKLIQNWWNNATKKERMDFLTYYNQNIDSMFMGFEDTFKDFNWEDDLLFGLRDDAIKHFEEIKIYLKLEEKEEKPTGDRSNQIPPPIPTTYSNILDQFEFIIDGDEITIISRDNKNFRAKEIEIFEEISAKFTQADSYMKTQTEWTIDAENPKYIDEIINYIKEKIKNLYENQTR